MTIGDSMRHKKAVLVSALLVAATVLSLAFAFVRPGFGGVSNASRLSAMSATERAALSGVSSPGVPVDVPPQAAAALAQVGFRQTASLLATRGDMRFFHFEHSSPGQRDCFGTGRVGDPTLYRVIMCRFQEPFFPSPAMPILDVSLVDISNANPTPHYLHVAGFAADGVAAIGVLNAAGDVVQTVPVQDNVYYTDSLASGTVAKLVALHAAGHVVGHWPS
jgi:hypothetical protein